MVDIPEKNDFCIYCFDFNDQGQAVDAKQSGSSDDSELTWWHLDALNPDTAKFLINNIGLSPIIVRALVEEDTRPRLEEFDDGRLIILRGVNTMNKDHPDDMISLRIWIDDGRIITMRRRFLRSIQDMAERLKNGHQIQTPGDILNTVIDRLLSYTAPVIDKIQDECDSLEESVIEDPDKSLRHNITSLRKQAITMRRYLAPQRDVLTQLRANDFSGFSVTNKREFQEQANYFLRLVEDLDMLRERTQIIQDELTTALADALNRNMYLLSVIAAIFLPLGFLTGLLGINVGGIPGSENSHAFWYFCGGLSILIFLQVLWFKKAKWF